MDSFSLGKRICFYIWKIIELWDKEGKTLRYNMQIHANHNWNQIMKSKMKPRTFFVGDVSYLNYSKWKTLQSDCTPAVCLVSSTNMDNAMQPHCSILFWRESEIGWCRQCLIMNKKICIFNPVVWIQQKEGGQIMQREHAEASMASSLRFGYRCSRAILEKYCSPV